MPRRGAYLSPSVPACQTMDPELVAAMAALPAPSTKKPTTIAEARDQMDKLFTARFVAWSKMRLPPGMSAAFFPELHAHLIVSQTASTYTLQDRIVPVEGSEITVRCTTPAVEDENTTFPLLFNIHGGCTSFLSVVSRFRVLTIFATAWVFCDISLEDYYLRRVCVDLQISVVNVNYRHALSHRLRIATSELTFRSLAPEHPFPTPGNDCLAALRWVRLMLGCFYCYHGLSHPIIDGRERGTPESRPVQGIPVIGRLSRSKPVRRARSRDSRRSHLRR